MSTKKMDWPRLCMICSTYVKGSELRDHMKSHAGKINHQCPYCFEYIKSNDMPNHMKSHTGDKPYYCTECKFRCKSKTMIKFHKKREHNWEENNGAVVSRDPDKESTDEENEEYPTSTSSNTAPSEEDSLEIKQEREIYPDSNEDSESSSEIPQNAVKSFYCQLCFTTVASSDIESHKCINSFKRSDYHFLLKDRHFELSSTPSSSDIQTHELGFQTINELEQAQPFQIDAMPTNYSLTANYPSLKNPDTLVCGICSLNVNINEISKHMEMHNHYKNENDYLDDGRHKRARRESPNFKISSFIDITSTANMKQLPQEESTKSKGFQLLNYQGERRQNTYAINDATAYCRVCCSYILLKDIHSHNKLHDTSRLIYTENNYSS
ncbi:putative zinc finger protein 840 [Cimex lectularius]|uniref:C2H2-type domain-containing protein n=1 Tax=Cimex lectularius TaxID=79782 RepID=A0A8I6RB43_CIMLE|nr:putative zinc finger protein 840 [Cimex lectularius]XP_014241878.1 putative zinc finger protein 840 [Cimex lectularius]